MPTLTFRLHWHTAANPQRTLTEEALLDEIERGHDGEHPDAPPGPITIDALDGQHRVCWRAYCRNVDELPSLACLLRSGELPARRSA